MMAYWFSSSGQSQHKTFHFVGETYRATGAIEWRVNGLHAVAHPSDGLGVYGPTIDMVELSGKVLSCPWDTLVASERHHVARIHGARLLFDHARWCALRVAHLWNPPNTVREFLESGDGAGRAAAQYCIKTSVARHAYAASWCVPTSRFLPHEFAMVAAWDAVVNERPCYAAREAEWLAYMTARRDDDKAAIRADLLARVNAEFASIDAESRP